jgi:hypothetical protein
VHVAWDVVNQSKEIQMLAISNTQAANVTVLPRAEVVISVAGKKIADRARMVLESSGNNRALRMMMVGDKGAVGKVAMEGMVGDGVDLAVKQCAAGTYTAVIGRAAQIMGMPLRDNRATYVSLTSKIDDQILVWEHSTAKTAAKKLATLRALHSDVTEIQARAEALYQRNLEAKKNAEMIKADTKGLLEALAAA